MYLRRSATSRRQFLTTALGAGAAVAVPQIIPATALGTTDIVAPSERITVGGIGLGGRGSSDLGCFLRQPDVQFVAVCDVRAARRVAIKQMVDKHHNNENCATYRDLRDLLARDDIDAVLIATGPNWHCTASVMAAEAGKDMYCEKPCTKNIRQSLILAETMRRTGRVFQAGTQRRSVPHFQFAVQLAQSGKLGKLTSLHAHPGGMGTGMSGWGKEAPEPNREEADWDLWLGPAAWRPYSEGKMRSAFGFEKGGGLVGGGVLEWGSHCVDLCQWANETDDTFPIEYHPAVDGRAKAFYADGVELVLRGGDWIGLGSCPVRFEGDEGWVEVGDSGKIVLSSPELSAGRDLPNSKGYPATGHVRNFLNCVKTRSQPLANADVACNGHIACHALNVAIFLGRTVKYDPTKHEFIDDEEANRLRSEALRSPWRL